MHFQKFENVNSLGNYLVSYFYFLALEILEMMEMMEMKDKKNNISFPFYDSSKNFVRHFPFSSSTLIAVFGKEVEWVQSQFVLHNITKEKLMAEGCDNCLWNVSSSFRQQFWNAMFPLVHNIMDQALQQSNLAHLYSQQPRDHVVIHFRCSDTPFVKHKQYHFQRYEFFKHCLQTFFPSSVTDFSLPITFLSCHTHLASEKNGQSCQHYVSSLVKYLNSLGYYHVKLQCETNVEDFATIFYAPCVISTGSSFSFMAGYFGHGKFISSQHFDDKYIPTLPPKHCKKCEWMLTGFDIPHAFVDNYHDISKVVALLSSQSL
jgi:hypothetical protein